MSLLSRLAVQAARAYGILSAADKTKVVSDYLVVAGGGGSGTTGGSSYAHGGGGGGGLLTSTFTLSTLNTYSISVGAGGATATSGSNSIISGTGLSTVTSTGGGRGGDSSQVNGANGGSGGGGSSSSGGNGTGGTGTVGQGNNGGTGTNSGSTAGGGGGGASAAGTNASVSSSPVPGTGVGGNGGNGSASSISGSSVTYAGGGGGGGGYSANAGTGGSGGSGGGGAGSGSGSGTAGTANLGGGGGGGRGNFAGVSGGSGIVIISYTSATPKFVGGTITTSARQLGGYAGNGGGGAGGLLSGSTTIYSGATYVVTVGAGGAGGTTSGVAPSGSNSVLSGTGLTTLTSTGGGGGGGSTGPGANGGSGGGGSGEGTRAGGTGTSGQGNNGGNGVNAGGGGGGSGAAGSVAVTITGGGGGVGTSSSISGTATFYAGGGGGGAYSSGTAGTGGSGGGGNGGAGTSNTGNTPGTANTGGGAGGTAGDPATAVNGQSGGSGIVIISYAGSQVFNGGLVTSSGGNTIHTFTSTGALTPLTNNLNNSLRFRSSASAYLNRTPTATGSQQKFTLSTWVKLGSFATGVDKFIWASADNAAAGVNPSLLWKTFSGTYTFIFDLGTGGGLTTTQVFRDPSAWYHVVINADTTQATAADRMKMYINGNQVTAFSSATYPTQNTNILINTPSYPARIGGVLLTSSTDRFFDGYMADINFIDGQALEPYYFGNNDANGVWKPILYKGTYGTNGYYLTFGNTTSTTTLGYDSSPNGNNWTTNNISLTAGTTYDAMTDVPTNTSATVANYAVLDPLDPTTSGNMTLSNANLTMTTSAANRSRLSTIYVPSGKWYAEVTFTTASGSLSGCMVGLCRSEDATSVVASYLGSSTNSYGYNQGGDKYNAGSATAYGASYTNNDIIGIAFDADAGTVTFYKNNTSQGTAFTGLSTSSLWSIGVSSGISSTSANIVSNINFGQRPFSYTPPTGFVALNTFNLPTPTILQGNKYMDATLYTQNGAASNVIVNAGQFKPDLVWIKNRDTAGTWNNLVDSVRGGSKTLYSNATNAEGTDNFINTFNSNGFTLNIGDSGTNNTAGRTQVGWQWQAGQGSTSSNTSGSITSTVSVNATAGFSVVSWTANGVNGATIGHGLGVAPAMMIFKERSAAGNNWSVYHKSIGNTGRVFLDLTNATSTSVTAWNNTSPTSTVFTVGTSAALNTNGSTMVGYCWAEIAGFSKFGSYTGNGSTDGPFIYTGFRPSYILLKRTDAANVWLIGDSKRDGYNSANPSANKQLQAQAANTESNFDIDYLSNGFKLRNTDSYLNASGGTYIYAAFAENPFKNALAR